MEQFEALFRFSTMGMIITESSGAIVNVNTVAETLFGYEKQELPGQKIEVLIPDQF